MLPNMASVILIGYGGLLYMRGLILRPRITVQSALYLTIIVLRTYTYIHPP